MGIYDKAKDAAQILRKADKIDEYKAILDLIEDLFDKQNKISEMRDHIQLLEKKIQVGSDYSFKKNAYYNKDTNDGPFCSRCFDKNKELIRIVPIDPESNHAKCPECKNHVNYTGEVERVHTHTTGNDLYT